MVRKVILEVLDRIKVKDTVKMVYFSLIDIWGKSFKKNKIQVINLNAIDICNSKCQMCNIWQQKEDRKISPEEFGLILENSLFKNVEYVGVTGGEPTLREDLLQLYEELIKKLRRLKGLSIITNAIKSDIVLEKVLGISGLCKSRDISFSAMISLDGVGAVHDRIRGIPGNFKQVEKLIKGLRDHNIDLSLGCTISKDNVWDVDELLDYFIENNLYGRFRVAEFINRLYNNDNSKVIRNFTEDEKYHLAIFFHKLEVVYEKNDIYKRTYRNIRNMLLGGDRQIGCPYQSQGLVLNSEGGISYCAPKSPILGNALNQPADKIYEKNLSIRQSILDKDCKNCIHDYHHPQLFKEFFKECKRKSQSVFFSTRFIPFSRKVVELIALSSQKIKAQKAYRITVVGWYGTETVGDKAILGGILKKYNEKYKNLDVIVGSIFPYVTERTLKEMDIEAKVVNSKSFDLISQILSSDEVIMGGGPLMDLEELMIPYLSFYTARKWGVKTTIAGCGIGPLYIKKYENIVRRLLELSDEISLRDKFSQEYAKKYLNDELRLSKDIAFSGDPARSYILDDVVGRRVTDKVGNNKNELALFLRDWTFEYGKKYSYQEFIVIKENFEKGLAKLIDEIVEERKIESVRFYHMHNLVMGNDDRDFSRRFIRTYMMNKTYEVSYDKGLSTIDSVCVAMKNAKFSLCMRFHSMVFADTLGVDYKVIDYTLGGKIRNFLSDTDKLDRMICFKEVSEHGAGR
ncbi:MAG: radical SAM protein [Halobacteriovoraceae bacterium]|nr:radical SAM protein [Halobacteriovoraceae bacterium]|tara:strand:+ start:55149 stop:57374 length:2226 start_codon:yes stop_codon:yes gene_type:complete